MVSMTFLYVIFLFQIVALYLIFKDCHILHKSSSFEDSNVIVYDKYPLERVIVDEVFCFNVGLVRY